MPRMYVANATKQVFTFMYTLPEHRTVRTQIIQVGQQVMVADGDLRTEDLDAILQQHERYGLINVDRIRDTKTFTGYCYSLDKPVKMDSIAQLIDHNKDMLEQLGRQVRQETAVAMNNGLEASVDERTQGASRLKEMEVLVVEEKPELNTVSKPLAEGFRVSREAEPERGNIFGGNRAKQQRRR